MTMRRLPISNRKLYKVALGIIVSMGFCLAYLVYSDIYKTQIDGTNDDGVDAMVDAAFRTRNPGKGHVVQRNLKNPLIIHHTSPISEHSKNEIQIVTQRVDTIDEPVALKQSSRYSSDRVKIDKTPTGNGAASWNEHTLAHSRGKNSPPSKRLDGEMLAPGTDLKADPVIAGLGDIKPEGEKRYLIYVCESLTWCGGWGDRQRGMTSVYFLSKIIGREFRIVMTTPCNLLKFYRPYKVNWLWDSQAITNSSFVISDIFQKSDFRSLISNGNFNTLFPQRVVYIKTNHDYLPMLLKNPFYADSVKKYKISMSKKGRFRWAWGGLMQPSKYLLQRLQNVVGTDILIRKGLLRPGQPTTPAPEIAIGGKSPPLLRTQIDSKLICAHVRFGRNPTIPMDEDFDSIKPSDIPKLKKFLQAKDKTGDARFFVATDFEGVRTEFRNFFGDKLIDYGGKILHIDRQRRERNACLGFEVALLDQLILSVCDVLVISRSGFSIHASYYKNGTEPVYIMEDGTISIFRG